MNELEKLYSFIQKYKNSTTYTHVITCKPYDSYNIPDNQHKQFMTLYENAIIAKYHPHIAEKYKDFGPIVIDFIQDNNYTETTIKNIIRLYNKVIRRYLKSVQPNQMYIYVTKLHIIYPFICLELKLQIVMHNLFLKLVKEENIPAMNKNHSNWLLYGSNKNKLTHIYNIANGKIYDTLMPGELNSKKFIRHLINILSVRKDMTPTPLLINKNNIVIMKVSEELLTEIRKLVPILSPKRDYLQIGMCLHNIDYRLLHDWIIFSQKSEVKYEELWNRMQENNYTVAALHYFASKDNPEKYVEIRQEKINMLIQDGLEGSHQSIAQLLTEKYRYIYKCTSINNLWYEFKNHIWVEINRAYTLRNLISSELVPEYHKLWAYYYERSEKTQGYEKEESENRAVYVSKVIAKLQNSNFKKAVMTECAFLMYDSVFLKKFDENMNLIHFKNGIYDLDADIFRDGCPDDYVSLCTGYDYIKCNKYVTEINNFLGRIQSDRKYLMTLLSTCLSGFKSEEKVYIWNGGNGKDILMELFKYTLGDYFKSVDMVEVNVLTKKPFSSAAQEMIKNKKGIRVCLFDEPEATDKINISYMKIFTSLKKPVSFELQFKPFLLCDKLPCIKNNDMLAKLVVIPFEKIKEITDEKILEWRQTFMNMLIDHYREYRRCGMIYPRQVQC